MNKFSTRSLNNLKYVSSDLVVVTTTALVLLNDMDFGVICGYRSEEEQLKLWQQGKTQLKSGSMHEAGEAVDVLAYKDGVSSYNAPHYDSIADAFKEASILHGIPIRWGGCWHINNIADWGQPMERARYDYIKVRRAQGRVPFVDSMHFEIADDSNSL